MSIYLEARIHGQLNELWEKTQNPELHERWDARFTSIKYLPRAEETDVNSVSKQRRGAAEESAAWPMVRPRSGQQTSAVAL